MIHTDRFAAWRSMPRHGLYVVIFNTAIAALLTAAGLGDRFNPDFTGRLFVNFVYSQCIGLLAWFLIDAPRHLLWPGERPRLLWFLPLVIGALLAATYGGSWLGALLLGHPWTLRTPLTSLVITATAGFLAVMYLWERRRAETIERQIAEARLKLLQAQIEPHFLFNTLANLDALIGTDPERARVMLGHLNDYLRATLASARKQTNTLADEFALLTGYLEVIGVRMGARLAFGLELPEALKPREIPPMLLQPLVENAIRHGLEPKLEGGRVDVVARAEGAGLVIRIADTGIGPGNGGSPGTGLGLAHVRERLAAAYGAGGGCKIEPNPGGGSVVTLRIPR